MAGLQELNLTQTRLSPEGSWFSFYYLPFFPHFLTHSNDLLLLMKIWITKMLNGNKASKCRRNFARLKKRIGICFGLKVGKKTFFMAEAHKKCVFVSLLSRADVVLHAELRQNTAWMIHGQPDASDREQVSLPQGLCFVFLTPITRSFGTFQSLA